MNYLHLSTGNAVRQGVEVPFFAEPEVCPQPPSFSAHPLGCLSHGAVSTVQGEGKRKGLKSPKPTRAGVPGLSDAAVPF